MTTLFSISNIRWVTEKYISVTDRCVKHDRIGYLSVFWTYEHLKEIFPLTNLFSDRVLHFTELLVVRMPFKPTLSCLTDILLKQYSTKSSHIVMHILHITYHLDYTQSILLAENSYWNQVQVQRGLQLMLKGQGAPSSWLSSVHSTRRVWVPSK